MPAVPITDFTIVGTLLTPQDTSQWRNRHLLSLY
jgi:hypothetical protein